MYVLCFCAFHIRLLCLYTLQGTFSLWIKTVISLSSSYFVEYIKILVVVHFFLSLSTSFVLALVNRLISLCRSPCKRNATKKRTQLNELLLCVAWSSDGNFIYMYIAKECNISILLLLKNLISYYEWFHRKKQQQQATRKNLQKKRVFFCLLLVTPRLYLCWLDVSIESRSSGFCFYVYFLFVHNILCKYCQETAAL